jgi:hypothetical protein
LHTWRSWTIPGGPNCIYRGPVPFHGGPDLFTGGASVSDSLDTWRHRTCPYGGGQVLLLDQSKRPRLGRVVVWSHIQVFYHTTKDSRVGTVPLYNSKGYPCFRVPTMPRPSGHKLGCRGLKGKCALGPFLSVLVIKCPTQMV